MYLFVWHLNCPLLEACADNLDQIYLKHATHDIIPALKEKGLTKLSQVNKISCAA